MCFSAEVSFVFGGILTVAGGYTIYKTQNKSYIPFACIPLLFGVQQIVEGFVWMSLGGHSILGDQNILKNIYLFFAETLRPIYVPLAILCLETTRQRKKLLLLFCIIGLLVGGFLFSLVFQGGIGLEIQEYHIVYTLPVSYRAGKIIWIAYTIATIGAVLVSSDKKIRQRGYILAVSLALTLLFYMQYFISVRCFFAAILSFFVYKIIVLPNLTVEDVIDTTKDIIEDSKKLIS